MKETRRSFLVLMVFGLFFSLTLYTCDAGVASAPDMLPQEAIIPSARPREISPIVVEIDLTKLVAGNRAFAFDLYQAVREENSNLFYSPYSISLALAMTYAGARTKTERQMANTLHFTLPQDRLHHAFNALDLELASRGDDAAGQDGQGFRLNIANALWGQIGFSFLPEFLDTLADNYGAGLRLLDFEDKPEESRIIINDWVSDQTEGKIEDLIPEGVITEMTRLVLTNAIYFNAAWLLPFAEERTHDGTFHLLDGGRVTVSMMSNIKMLGYAEGKGFQAVELLYDGGEVSMVVLLPKAGRFKKFEKSLEAKRVGAILKGLQLRNVALMMPKFTYESSFDLNKTLMSMGMSDAFSPGKADFSGMDGKRDLFISAVVHKAFILSLIHI